GRLLPRRPGSGRQPPHRRLRRRRRSAGGQRRRARAHHDLPLARRLVDVGVYFDLRNPPGWRRDWSRLYGFTLEMCEEAERLGARTVWLSEHHMFEDGYLTQPFTFAAAIAARTSRIRIGTAVVLAPLRPAVQIAEEAVVVDIVSGGRVDVGLGAGYRVPEFELFGADIGRRYTTTDSRARELRQIWSDERMMPPPVQDRTPIWMGYQGPQGAR